MTVFSITAPIVAIWIFVASLLVYVAPASKILRSPTTPLSLVGLVTSAVPLIAVAVQSDMVVSVVAVFDERYFPATGIIFCRAFTAL